MFNAVATVASKSPSFKVPKKSSPPMHEPQAAFYNRMRNLDNSALGYARSETNSPGAIKFPAVKKAQPFR